MKKISRNEGLLILGQWTSKIGDIVFDYVNSIAIVSTFTNSMWILALYQNSQVVINILFNLIGGVVADLGKRKNIIIVSDCLSAIICFFASFFLNSDCMVIALVIANALLALVFSFSSPTFKSITKEIVDKNRIGFFNSISNAGIDLIKLVGPVVGFALVKVVGTRGALLIDAITFAISAGTEALLITHEHNSNSIAENTRKRRNILLYSLEGVKYLLGEKKVFHLVVLSAFVNFFLAGYDLLVPYTEIIYCDGFYSKVLIVEAMGGILGASINAKLPHKIMQNSFALTIFLGLTGLPLLIIPISKSTENIAICLLPFFMFGIFLTMFNINFMTCVQTCVNEDYLGRVFSVIFTVATMFMPAGSFVFSSIMKTPSITSFTNVGMGIVFLSLAGLRIFYKKETQYKNRTE